MAGSDDRRRQLVIVALPSEEDQVRKFSSEKEPHLTLLYLGEPEYDDEQFMHIEEYVAYASSQFQRFMMDVENRGELGPNQADVLFFSKKWAREITTFRDHLLQDPLISAAYHSTDQYPEWTPHLTMGYPDTPAKKDGKDTPRFYSVNFDRIALWTDEYAGREFPLNPYAYDMEVAMSQIQQGRSVVEGIVSPSARAAEIGEELAHYGVKGMKWGVRRSNDEKSSSSASKPSASDDVMKVDAHKQTIKSGTTRALSNKELREVVERMNLEQQYSGLVSREPTKIQRGHEKVKKVLTLGETAQKAYNMANSPAGKAIRKAIIGV